MNEILKSRMLPYLIIVFAAFFVYWPASNAPVILDDVAVLNAVREGSLFQYLSALFLLKARALAALSFRMNYELHGGWLFGYRLVNLAIHCANGIIVYKLISILLERAHLCHSEPQAKNPEQTTRDPLFCSGQAGFFPPRLAVFGEAGADAQNDIHRMTYASLFGALFFIVHPMQVQAVSYIAQRFVLLSAMFYFLAIYYYLAARDEKENSFHLGLVYLFALCAVMSKEIAITLPFAIILIGRVFPSKMSVPLSGRVKIYAPLFAIACVPVATRVLLGEAAAPWIFTRSGFSDNAGASYFTYALTQLNVLVEYLRFILWPSGLHFMHDVVAAKSFLQPDVLSSFVIHLSLVVFAVLIKRRQPLAAFGILFYYLAHFVESFTVPLIFSMFEYRCYLSMVGIAMVLAAALNYAVLSFSGRDEINGASAALPSSATPCDVQPVRLGRASSGRLASAPFISSRILSVWVRKAVIALSIACLVSLSAVSIWHNILYSNPVVLWVRSVEMSPKQPLAHAWLGLSYMEAGLFREAIWQFLVAKQSGVQGMDKRIGEARAAIERERGRAF